eukprot:scaffold1861_cov111-Isochrysis_galbana.AAC.6
MEAPEVGICCGTGTHCAGHDTEPLVSRCSGRKIQTSASERHRTASWPSNSEPIEKVSKGARPPEISIPSGCGVPTCQQRWPGQEGASVVLEDEGAPALSEEDVALPTVDGGAMTRFHSYAPSSAGSKSHKSSKEESTPQPKQPPKTCILPSMTTDTCPPLASGRGPKTTGCTQLAVRAVPSCDQRGKGEKKR